MDAVELTNKMAYSDMERNARKILLEEKLTTADELAVMARFDVCSRILEHYEVVSCESKDDITIVKKENMKAYNDIVRYLNR